MKTIIKKILNSRNISYFKNIDKNKLYELIKLFHPYDLGYDLIRVGDNKDGGYLIPNCLDDIKFCFSAGVDDKVSFENDLYNRNIKSFLADYSQESKRVPEKFIFEKKYIKSFNSSDALNINDWISSKKEVIKSENLIFQIDVEGYEYEIINSIEEKKLDQIKILIIEFHDLEYSGNRIIYQMIDSVMKKILKKFDVAHIHPNNWKEPTLINGLKFPSNLEATFLNKNFVKSKGKINFLPHKLDVKNVLSNPDVKLDNYWYL
ncbi:MAG: hypothetical protein CMF94_00070 [Candidatus Marinimicrobia bacterium]|nr:hypothetical protein [Candidatus Neomarinimicrobiota bacterium]